MSKHEQIASEFNTMRGRILGLIESWGLPATQERGAKATFKSLSYDAEQRIKSLIVECTFCNDTGEIPRVPPSPARPGVPCRYCNKSATTK
jgi:hypothetical protein